MPPLDDIPLNEPLDATTQQTQVSETSVPRATFIEDRGVFDVSTFGYVATYETLTVVGESLPKHSSERSSVRIGAMPCEFVGFPREKRRGSDGLFTGITESGLDGVGGPFVVDPRGQVYAVVGVTVVVAVATLQSGPGHTDPGSRRSVHVVARLRPRDPGLCLAQQWRGTPAAVATYHVPIKWPLLDKVP